MIWEAVFVSKKLATGGVLVLTIFGIALEQWLAIGVGLGIGILARWSYLLSVARTVGWRDVRIDLMAAPMNGILAAQILMTTGMHNERIVLAAGMLGAG